VDDVVFGVFWFTIGLKKSVLKGERKWVMLCLVSLFYCSRVFFLKRKKVGEVVFSIFLFTFELFYSSRVCFERIWKGQIRWAIRIFLDISPYDLKRQIERSNWWRRGIESWNAQIHTIGQSVKQGWIRSLIDQVCIQMSLTWSVNTWDVIGRIEKSIWWRGIDWLKRKKLNLMMKITINSITFVSWVQKLWNNQRAHHLVKGIPTSPKAQQGTYNTNFKPKLTWFSPMQ
jgi:hypothetical protein